MGLLSLLTLGFFLGMRHATDSDHVVAVGAIVSRERSIKAASLIGALWGIGHTVTIMIVGGAIVLFGVVFPARVGLTMEFSVALMLVLLGALNVAGFRREVQGLQARHAHPGHPEHLEHAALHVDEIFQGKGSGRLGAWLKRLGAYGAVRSLVVGTVHGLAGSAAVALLVLATIHDSRSAILYLLVFGVGTVAGMMLITSALAVPLLYSARQSPSFGRHASWVTGLLSLGLGLFLVYHIGFVDGLFRATPHWDPH